MGFDCVSVFLPKSKYVSTEDLPSIKFYFPKFDKRYEITLWFRNGSVGVSVDSASQELQYMTQITTETINYYQENRYRILTQ